MITNHVVTERGTNVCTDLTSVQWWRQSGRCRCYWRAERRSPSRRERSASCVTRGWAFAACRRRSWSSRPHGGAGSRNRSLCWCYTPASWPYCSPGGSGNGTRDTTFNASYCLTFGFVSSTLGKVTTTPSIHPSITPSTNKTILESLSVWVVVTTDSWTKVSLKLLDKTRSFHHDLSAFSMSFPLAVCHPDLHSFFWSPSHFYFHWPIPLICFFLSYKVCGRLKIPVPRENKTRHFFGLPWQSQVVIGSAASLGDFATLLCQPPS